MTGWPYGLMGLFVVAVCAFVLCAGAPWWAVIPAWVGYLPALHLWRLEVRRRHRAALRGGPTKYV